MRTQVEPSVCKTQDQQADIYIGRAVHAQDIKPAKQAEHRRSTWELDCPACEEVELRVKIRTTMVQLGRATRSGTDVAHTM
eukprot:4399871-Pleurochrysis_carterae.AAC.7